MTDCLKKVMSCEKDKSLTCEKCGKKGEISTTSYLKSAPPQMIMKLCRASLDGKIFKKKSIFRGDL